MVLSDEKKFIFIHIYKTGGTSLVDVLSKFSHPTITRKNTNGHATAIDLKWLLELSHNHTTFDDYHKFCVVRNPYSWHVSLYNWIKRDIYYTYPSKNGYPIIMRETNTHKDSAMFKKMTFNDYVIWLRDEGSKRPKFRKDIGPNFRDTWKPAFHTFQDFIRDEDGNIVVDDVLKIENLQSDFDVLCKKLDLGNITIPHLNKGFGGGWKEAYNDNSKEIITEIHKEDLDMFGYKFE